MPIAITSVGLSQVGLIVAGGAIALIGAWALFHRRSKRSEAFQLHIAGEGDAPKPRLSEPTRYAIGVCGLILGYNLIVWAFPIKLTPVQLPSEWWWVWILLAVGGIGLSVLMDRFETRDARRSGDGDSGGGG